MPTQDNIVRTNQLWADIEMAYHNEDYHGDFIDVAHPRIAAALDAAQERGRRRALKAAYTLRVNRLKHFIEAATRGRDEAIRLRDPIMQATYGGKILALSEELKHAESQLKFFIDLHEGEPKAKPITDEELAKLTGDDAAPGLRQPDFVIEIPKE